MGVIGREGVEWRQKFNSESHVVYDNLDVVLYIA